MPDALFLNAAERIARRLCRDAIWSGHECNWLGWAVDVFGRNWSSVYKAQTPMLYDGTAGIALFLARVWRLTGERTFAETAIGALNHSFAALSSLPEEARASVYSGALGIAWSAVAVGTALDDERMVQRGMREAAEAGRLTAKTPWLDVLGGCAGAIQALVELDLPELARAHGDHLLRVSVHSDAGWSWDTMPGQTTQNVCGYGHGAGGIGCALLELWSATGEKRYRQAAQEAFRYERSHYSAAHRNWPDLRDMTGYTAAPNEPVYAMGWCHGAPGIGFSRLRAHQLLPNDTGIAGELEIALATTADACRQWVAAPGSGLSLCHGLGGNADLLIAAADALGRPGLRQVAEDAARTAIQQIEPNDMPWPCGVNGGGETPNLMLGLSGIGHFFLRLYDSAAVPSLLLLHRRKQQERVLAKVV
jgi:lantibiotic modifying enzyme